MKDNFDPPSIAEELNRKALDELESLVNNYERGKINSLQYQASIGTLFNVVSGLTDSGFFDLITQAGDEVVIDHSFYHKRLFRKGDKISLLSIAPVGQFPLRVLSATVLDEKAITGDQDEIRDKVNKFVTKLQSVGFAEIL